MQRLTNDKKTSQMTMSELAFNCCYAKDDEAWYRDYDTNIQAREFVRNLYKHYTGFDLPKDNEVFDEILLDDLFNEPDMAEGLLALFYRNLWGMAELRERLKEYEDLEEQGLLLRLPIKIGDTVYTSIHGSGWYFREKDKPYEAEIVFIGINASEPFMNIEYKKGYMLSFKLSEIGERIFLTKEEAEKKLREMEAEE